MATAIRWSTEQLAAFEQKKVAVAAYRQGIVAQAVTKKAVRHAEPSINDQLSESAIQKAFIEWGHAAECSDWRLSLLFSVPNGGKRGIKTALTLQAEGLRPGVPDILLPYPCGGFVGLALEFKSKDGTIKDAQDKFMADLERAGWRVEVVRSTIAAIQIVENYLGQE